MKTTAAVINAELGDLILGLQMAGFEVACDYEEEKNDVSFLKTNLDIPVYPLSQERSDFEIYSEIDLLAARIRNSSFRADYGFVSNNAAYSSSAFLEKLACSSPRMFLLVLSPLAVNKKPFQEFSRDIQEIGYQFVWRIIDVGQMTGFPVAERKAVMVGYRNDMESRFVFPAESRLPVWPLEKYLELGRSVDRWYYNLNPNGIPQPEDGKLLYCWKDNSYKGTELASWNHRKVPLVWDGDVFRKITIQEIARLKGFPDDYPIDRGISRSQLYTKLMYSFNVSAVRQFAREIQHILLPDSPWQNQQIQRSKEFESLFLHYLTSLTAKEQVRSKAKFKDHIVDFEIDYRGKRLYFELKYYKNSSIQNSRIKELCRRLSPLNEAGLPVLVVADKVPDSLKKLCWEDFKVCIWDIENLLWLFDDFPDIKNEFVALLDFAVGGMEPKPPMPDLLEQIAESEPAPPEPEAPAERQPGRTSESRPELPVESEPEPSKESIPESHGWRTRLEQIAPGREQFSDYQSICVEILKYVFGDYLTMWNEQAPSSDGLYRFDLCCKIKHGVNHDFFDTIKRHFNTKFIVFEFKNYNGKITQKEIYTTEKYLYEKAMRKVAVIVSRQGADEHALQAAKGSLRESGKLILCLSDRDLLQMIDIKARGVEEPAEFLNSMLDDIFINLEK